MGHAGAITQAAIAGIAPYVVSSSHDQTTRIWDPAQQTVPLYQPVPSLNGYRPCFTPDGLLIVGVDREQGVRICDAATGKLVRNLKVDASHAGEMSDPFQVVAVSPDNRLLAIGVGRTVELWNLDEGNQIAKTASVPGKSERSRPTALAFSPDGEFLVVAFGWFNSYMSKVKETDGEFPIGVFDVATGQLIQSLAGHRNAIQSVALSRDGRLLASASHDRTVRVWDTTTWATIQTLPNPDPWDYSGGTGAQNHAGALGLEDVAFSPDGTDLPRSRRRRVSASE